MIRKAIYLSAIILGIFLSDAEGQNSQTSYYMNIPQNHLLNPALRPSNSLYIGIPVLTGININVNNNFVNFSDVLIKGQASDSIISFLHPDYNIDNFLDKIKVKNSLEPEITVQLFGLGFAVGEDSYVFLDINDRVDGNVVIPGDLFALGFRGNEEFVGSQIDLSSLRADMKYYREIGIGMSRQITGKLRIGAKVKLLQGIASVFVDNRSLAISVNEDYSHTIDADLTMNISAPVKVIMDADNNIDSLDFDDSRFDTGKGIFRFLSGKGNTGLGLDIGATYDITEKIQVSAAVTDLGYIRWKKDITNLQAASQFEFSGLNMLDVINGTKTFDEVGEEMLDSLKNSFEISDFNDPFTTWLPVGITFGGSYNLTQNISLGLLSYSRIHGNQIHEDLTLSANANIGNAFSASLSYTAANHRFDNLGAGLAFRAGVVQFYFMADRIPFGWNKIVSDENTVSLPANWNTLNLRFGMNLTFGNRVKKKNDNPMVIVE